MMHQVPSDFGEVKDLISRYDKAKGIWETWRSLHQEAFDYAAPNRETFTVHSEGQKKNRQIFDSTAVIGLQRFSNRIQSALFPPWQKWLSFEAGEDIPDDEAEGIDQDLESITDKFFAELNHSNFYTELHPSLVDLGIGTGAIMVEEAPLGDSSRVVFTNVPLAELVVEKPSRGNIENCWRCFKVKPNQIERTWPGASLPMDLAKLAEKPDCDEQELIIGMLRGKDELYHQFVIHVPTKHLIFHQTFRSKRLIPFRWSVTPGEAYGRGPIIQQLPDIRTANKLKQFILENAALQIAGVYTAKSDGYFNPHTVRIAPGAIIPVGSNGTDPTLAPLQRSGELGIGDALLEQLQESIRDALFVNPLGDLSDPVRSATEMMIRNQENLRNAGASFGRLKTELVEPLVNAVMDILSDLGEVPDIAVNGKEVTIRQVSPLSKAESMEDFQNSQVWFQNVSVLPPEVVAASVKVEDIPGYWQDLLGVPAKLIRTEEERQALAQTVSQAAQQGIESGGLGQ